MADISLLPPDPFEIQDDDDQSSSNDSSNTQEGGDPFDSNGRSQSQVESSSATDSSGIDDVALCFLAGVNDQDDDEGGGDGGGDADSGVSSQQDDECLMSPSQRLDKYALSNNVLYRQMVPSVFVEILRESNPEELETNFPRLMETLSRVADDPEMKIRVDICSRLGSIAIACVEVGVYVPCLRTAAETYVLPLVAKMLGDVDAAVRKSAFTALLQITKQRCVSRAALEEYVCPKITHYTTLDAVSDYQTSAVTLMAKMVPIMGQEATEKLFLRRFAELCSNPMFTIRKICASSFGEFCAVVGPEAYETVLLPKFLELCCDEVWGVRKACAEVIMTVSCACPPVARRTKLAQAFAPLLDDQSRWVRMSAFQTLGPFISTFADPSVIGLSYNQMGELVLINPEGAEFRVNSWVYNDIGMKAYEAAAEFKQSGLPFSYSLQERSNSKIGHRELSVGLGSPRLSINSPLPPPPPPPPLHQSNDRNISKPEEEEELQKFNSHQYWYISPEMDLDPEIVNSCLDNSDRENNVDKIPLENNLGSNNDRNNENLEIDKKMENSENSEEENNEIQEEEDENWPNWHLSEDIITDNLVEKFDDLSFSSSFKSLNETELDETKYNNVPMELSESTSSQNTSDLKNLESISNDIVPPVLIAYFISMTDEKLATSTDNDMAYHCAYSLPAVALTLGRNNWHLLAKTCENLASDMQYKVRRTLASSLHELALILGQELTEKHLLPIFDGFIKDLDEVRVGVLRHLAHFLELISEEQRIVYLKKLKNFLQTDNEWNWRFREEFVRQLLASIPLYANKIHEAVRPLGPLAHTLLVDRVCAVRRAAIELTCEIVRHTAAGDKPLCTRLLFRLSEELAHSKVWVRRQVFALLCAQLVQTKALPPNVFATELMPHLLDLSWDPVPNVRLAVSRTLAQDIWVNKYFQEGQEESLQTVLRRMQSDKDRDVRYFADLEKAIFKAKFEAIFNDPEKDSI